MAEHNITPKENFLRLARGEMPEYVPLYDMGGMWPPTGEKPRRPPTQGAFLPIFFRPPAAPPDPDAPPPERTDMWGVPYASNPETNFAGLPKPGAFILDDIRNWHTILKVPDFVKPASEYDWDALSKAALQNIDREQKAVSAMMGDMPFMLITGLMGFTEGLVALVEEPEICCEMFDWLAGFYEPYIKKAIDYLKPDLWSLGDDNASKYAPFFSLETYRKVFKPIHARYAKEAKDLGIPVGFHDCGKCELFLEDYVDIGVKYWDPAQTTNDLLGIKEKFKGRLVVIGGFDFVPDINYNQVSEEYVREFTRSVIDKLAPGGGYAFLGGYLGRSDELDVAHRINTWINDEVDTYGYHFYDK
ncbi:MAG: veratrol--corrinoid protein metyltransferase [Eubacteriaceae bacterium]|nr:veratrol--corrinoid protein metyltransferase [Eubacteriaceae bacterium]